ncbi:GvpL/GvpF family gas vesicle protein [Candidatus Woesearchaeota archaeon]|nr:GvpL/GvpF family gas vesicle protein [Candidatus Woesearchaeota archaeon]
MGDGEYVYCIISRKNAPDNFGITGIKGEPVYCIHYNDLSAVVSKAPMIEYKATEENTTIHRDVNQHILKNHTVLPVALGMVFKNRGVLINTMRRVYGVLRRSLRLVDNKIELGVKAILPKDKEVFEGCVEKSVGEFRKLCEEEYLKELRELSVETKEGKLFSERLAFNYSFLVEREKIPLFTEKITTLEEKHNQLLTKYTGPWPPYNFVDIKIMGKGG